MSPIVTMYIWYNECRVRTELCGIALNFYKEMKHRWKHDTPKIERYKKVQ